MYEKDRKIKKTIRLDQDVVEAVEAFKNITNLDFTKSAEQLIMRGLENVDRTEQSEKRILSKLKTLEQKQKQDTERIVNLIIGLTRFQGRNYGLIKLLMKNLLEASEETVSGAENYGIKKAIEELKWRKQEAEHD